MNDTKLPEENKFSVVKRAESFTHAGRGVYVFIKSTHNAWVHITVLVFVIILGFYFNITQIQWLSIVLSCGFVLVSEAFNTAIEIDIDLTSPDFHPYAKDTKDVAAGAVLISALTAATVGLIVFLPHIMAFVK